MQWLGGSLSLAEAGNMQASLWAVCWSQHHVLSIHTLLHNIHLKSWHLSHTHTHTHTHTRYSSYKAFTWNYCKWKPSIEHLKLPVTPFPLSLSPSPALISHGSIEAHKVTPTMVWRYCAYSIYHTTSTGQCKALLNTRHIQSSDIHTKNSPLSWI